VVVDGDPDTAWSTEPGATPEEANVVLDLGQSRSIGRVRWLEAADGLSGRMDVDVSSDGKRWKKAAGEEQEVSAGWQELRLKQAVEARYVRVSFTDPSQESRLGGLAEVEIRPAAPTEANHAGPKPDRPRDASGASNAKSGHHHGSQDRNRGTSPNQGKDQNTPKSSRKRGKQRRGS